MKNMKKMKKMCVLLILVGVMMSFSGCATLLKGDKVMVNANSDPDGAEVFVNGEFYGRTPIKLQLNVNQSYDIEFRKEGYTSMTRHITNKIGAGWIILDVVCGVVPVVVDAITGAWYKLDQKNVGVVLKRQMP